MAVTKPNTHSKNIFSRYRDVMVCLFLVVFTLSVYWQVHNYDFVNFDDNIYVSDNRHVQGGLTLDGITWAFTTIHASNWHPLTWLSHMLDHQLYGLNPGGHHTTNLLFHIANSLLLFFIFRKMTGHFWQSAFLASLFALHPLHVESVAWISERKDVLSTFFWMLTMWSYIRYVQHPRIDKYLLALLFFILGLMSKPMLVTLPFVLLLLDYYPLGRFDKQADSSNSLKRTTFFRLILEKLPFFVLVVMSSVITFYAQKHGGAVKPLEIISIQARIANTLVSYASYILKMLCPSKLAVLYPHPGSYPWWQITGACSLLLFISFSAIRVIKQSPYFFVGWFWYLGTLVPVIGLVQVGSQSMADRYTYIPLIGIFMIISWGTPELVKRWHHLKIFLSPIAIAILFIFMVVAFFQVGYWKNSITLFEHTLKVTSNNYRAHDSLASALQKQGRIDEAIRHYEEVIRIRPDYVHAHFNLGVILKDQGRIDEAIEHYEEALRFKPDYADAHYNLGNALRVQGRIDEAIKHYKEAIRIKPDYMSAHKNLVILLKRQGRIDEAIKHYEEVLRIKPDFEFAHYTLGNFLKDQGRIDDAIRHYEEALRIKPDYVDAHNNLGIALIYKGDIAGAIDQFRKALQINPNYIYAKENLNKLLSTQKQ
jgi:tetratricopeptide (TPR) repeat protein